MYKLDIADGKEDSNGLQLSAVLEALREFLELARIHVHTFVADDPILVGASSDDQMIVVNGTSQGLVVNYFDLLNASRTTNVEECHLEIRNIPSIDHGNTAPLWLHCADGWIWVIESEDKLLLQRISLLFRYAKLRL
jgi:hypothetical protein